MGVSEDESLVVLFCLVKLEGEFVFFGEALDFGLFLFIVGVFDLLL